MSLNQLISDVHEKFNGRRSSVLAHTSMGAPFYTNGGCRQSDIKEAIQRYLQFVPEQLGATGKSNLHNFGKLTVGQNPKKKTSNDSEFRLVYRPAPKLKRACKVAKPGKIDSFETRVYFELLFTKKNVTEITRDFGHALTDALVKQGDLKLGALGTFLISGEQDSGSDNATDDITFTPSQYLKTELAQLSAKKIAGFDRKRAVKKTKRKQRTQKSAATGNLDRKQLAKIRKLLHSRDGGNVQMAMMLLDQLANQDDYRAVHATAGLIERLLRTDSLDVKAAAGQIVMKTDCQNSKRAFWKLIGMTPKKNHYVPRNKFRNRFPDSIQSADCVVEPSSAYNPVIESNLFNEVLAEETSIEIIRLEGCDRLTEINLIDHANLEEFSLLTAMNVELTLRNLPALMLLRLKVGSQTTIQLEQIPKLQGIDIVIEDDQCEFQLEPFLAANALQHIEAKGAAIRALPDQFGSLEALESLDVSSTGITSLPESFGSLTNLRELHLGNDVILPECFGSLTNLRELHLGKDVALPESFGNLTNLRKLVIRGDNHVDGQLGPQVGRLPALEELQVPIRTRLPIELGNISSLKDVKIGQDYGVTDQASIIILDLCRQAMAKRNS